MLERLKEKRNEEGFTLIELLIVIIILAILAAIVIFAVGNTSQSAKQSACNSDAKTVETAVEAYKAQMGAYPATMGALTTTATDPFNSETVGPWLRQAPSASTTANGYAVTIDTAGGVWVATNHDAATSYDIDPSICDSIT